MKKIYLTLLVATAVLFLSVGVQAQTVRGKTAWKIYKLAAPRTGPPQTLGRALLGDLKAHELDGRFQMVDPNDASVFFTQDVKTGDVSFSKSMKGYFGDKPPALVNPETAQKLAERFLRENKLLPGDMAQLQLIHVGGLRMSYTTDDQGGPVVDKLSTFTYGRQLDGVAVQGASSKFVVHVGDGGEIVGLSRRWREAIPVRDVRPQDLKSRAIAEREIRALIAREFTEAGQVELTNVALVYHDGGGAFIQPAWYFAANLNEKEFRLQYFGAVPALKRPPERIGPGTLDPVALRLIKRVEPTDRPEVNRKASE